MVATPDALAAAWAHVHHARPLCQCLTNVVSCDLMANALLAAGASPAMVSCEAEAGAFARDHASGILVNIGTLSPAGLAGQHAAVDAAVAARKPWVLDPVACGATSYRTQAAVDLARKRPALIRGNASEVAALAASVLSCDGNGPTLPAAGTVRGVDSTLDEADAPAAALAAALGCVVAVSGPTDTVVEPCGRVTRITAGVPMLTAITATGCTVTALCLAAIAAGWGEGQTGSADVAVAAAAGLAAMGVAAEKAVEAGGVAGPASLRVGLLDALHGLKGSDLAARVRLSIIF
jgi:hydroxyethylthiazole kinase